MNVSKNVLHHDLKSDNLLLDANGRVKVSDFGISKHTSNRTTTVGGGGVGAVKGSIPWMSLEHIQGRPFTQACDIYAYGVVMYVGDHVAQGALGGQQPDAGGVRRGHGGQTPTARCRALMLPHRVCRADARVLGDGRGSTPHVR